MIGLDVNAASIDRGRNSPPTQYRTWVVEGQPDFTGQFYTGEKSGHNPLVNITAYAILDDNLVCDFNLPNPLDWDNVYSVLPAKIYDSQLLVANGFVYMFGGVNSDVIWFASLNTPTKWEDSGARLPTPLAGSQLAVVDGYVYLFGGITNASLTSATNVILSAPLTNPLSWTNTGVTLPRKLSHSQLLIANGAIYLLGGYEITNASNLIFSASLSNPLLWTITSATLPDPLYGSALAINDGYAYLLGGLFDPGLPTSKIYAASLALPTFWTADGYMPWPVSYGQYCTIGAQGYLFTQGAVTNGSTSTLILQTQLNNFVATWKDTKVYIPGVVSQSQLAIIYDRIWLFGGNGNTSIFSCNSIIKYPVVPSLSPYYAAAQAYGNITRTQYQALSNPLDRTNLLGFPYWRTDYAV